MDMSFYNAASGADAFLKKLSVTSNNLANVNTNGFKASNTVFSELIKYNLNENEDTYTDLRTSAGVKNIATSTDFSQSSIVKAGENDYAILEENAFFMIEDPSNGKISYTRDGHFHKQETEDGFFLMTDSGKYVLNTDKTRFKADINSMDVSLDSDEYDEYDNYEDNEEQKKEEIGIVHIKNPSLMKKMGANEYVTDEVGVIINDPAIKRGYIETSTTDVSAEMVKIIESQRAFSYSLKMLKVSDEIEEVINTLRG